MPNLIHLARNPIPKALVLLLLFLLLFIIVALRFLGPLRLA
jgi:hypothetical protein